MSSIPPDFCSIRASAPGRAGIVGNPSDIYGGKVLSCSIPVRATCKLTTRTPSSLPEDRRLWDAATNRFPVSSDVEVGWFTDVPRSSGLSGSTALLAATLACLLRATNHAIDLETPSGKRDFAELVRDVERFDAKIMCGYQDAYMIVHGGIQLMDFNGKHPVNPGPPAQLKPIDAQLPFLLVSTGVERLSGSVHGPMAQRWLDGDPEVVSAMERLPDLATKGAEALVSGDLVTLGKAMDENHALIAALGGSGEPIDRLIEECKSHGAISAKLAGAGLGGTVIALTEDPDSLEASLREKGYARFIRPESTEGIRFEFDPAKEFEE